MKNTEIKETITSYFENKIIFGKINGSFNIISLNDIHIINYIDNNTGSKKRITISNRELVKYFRFLKHI